MNRLWWPVTESRLLTDAPLLVQILDQQVVIWRTNDGIGAIDASCKHYGGPLQNGRLMNTGGKLCLQCPNHGFQYDAAGMCVEIPTLPAERTIPTGIHTTAFNSCEAKGLVWVSFTNEPVFDVLDVPWLRDTRFWPGPIRGFDVSGPCASYGYWPTSVWRFLGQALDPTHFPFAHDGILGDPQNAASPEYKIWFEDRVLRVSYDTYQPKTGLGWDAHYELWATANEIVLEKSEIGDTHKEGQVLVIWGAVTQVSTNPWRLIRFMQMLRNYDVGTEVDKKLEPEQDVIEMQDFAMLGPGLPVVGENVMLVRPGDAPVLAYLQWMKDLELTF